MLEICGFDNSYMAFGPPRKHQRYFHLVLASLEDGFRYARQTKISNGPMWIQRRGQPATKLRRSFYRRSKYEF